MNSPRRDFLDRFRPVGAPGAAGPTGVPSHDEPGPADELAPVFAALAAAIAEAERTVDDAQAAAQAARDAAQQRAAAIVADARRQAPAAREHAAAVVERTSRNSLAAILRDAGREAARIEADAATGQPAIVARVLAGLRESAVP